MTAMIQLVPPRDGQSQIFPSSFRTPPYWFVPSGKRLHNYGKSQFLMGKSTINGNFQ